MTNTNLEWQLLSEAYPVPNKTVLVCTRKGNVTVGHYEELYINKNLKWLLWNTDDYDVIKWANIPLV